VIEDMSGKLRIEASSIVSQWDKEEEASQNHMTRFPRSAEEKMEKQDIKTCSIMNNIKMRIFLGTRKKQSIHA
jgi:hypothetical protein